jgi:hypothetical protein
VRFYDLHSNLNARPSPYVSTAQLEMRHGAALQIARQACQIDDPAE